MFKVDDLRKIFEKNQERSEAAESILLLRNKLTMMGVEPILHLLPDTLSQSNHLACFLIRHRANPLIPADISLLPKSAESSHEGIFRSYGQG